LLAPLELAALGSNVVPGAVKVPGDLIVSNWFFSSRCALHCTSTPPTALSSLSKAMALKMICSPVLISTSPGKILIRVADPQVGHRSNYQSRRRTAHGQYNFDFRRFETAPSQESVAY
jgi:hypothetical protein